MSIFNPLGWFNRRAPQDEQKASGAGPIYASRVLGRPIWTERNFVKLATEAYKINSVGFRCVKMISTNAASVKWLLHDTAGNEIEQHPLLDLLNRPNPVTGRGAFFEQVYGFLLLGGNSYIEAVGPNGKAPRELWTPRPDRMKVVPGQHGMPQAFEYSLGGRKKRWDVDPLTGDGEILHLKEFNPLDDWYGMSRVEAAAYGIDRHNAASSHNKALLDNGARPSGALIFEPVTGTNMAQPAHAPKEVIEAAEQELAERHTGGANAGKPMVLGGNVKWEEMGITPREMDFVTGKDDSAIDICLAWGVPHVLVVKGAQTYNNVREAKLELYEDTILPIIEMTADELNNWLTPKFGDNLILSPDLDSVSALEPRRESKRKSTVELLDKGVIDPDEAREDLQYGQRGAEMVRKVDASVLTALINAVETTGIQPLYRYMRSVGLIEAGTTEQQLLDAALSLIEDEEDDLDDTQPPELDEEGEEDE